MSMASVGSCVSMLGPCWDCFMRMRRCGPIGGGVSQGQASEISSVYGVMSPFLC